jgi:nitrous oxide reductase accessory protein NosL
VAMNIPGPDEIRAKVSARAFGNRIIQNDFRGPVAETIVESAQEPTWRCCSGDWLGWDFEHLDGTRLEVKQSAARQTWTAPKRPSPATFDIRTRSGFYVGNERHPGIGRHAHIYVFAYHPLADASANYLDPRQWVFYVVPVIRLSPNRTIGLAGSHRWLPPPLGRHCS